jgi:GNAT superfamily N-acetyltransferase
MSNTNIWSTNDALFTPRGELSSGPDSKGLEWKETLRDGTTVLIRPIREADIDIERYFIKQLSPQSRRFRFLGSMSEPSPALLKQLTHPDPKSELALVALVADGSQKREIGVARFSARADRLSCECAVVVSDAWHNLGLATILMQHLIEVARRRNIECMYSVDAANNQAMRDLAEHLGFKRKTDPTDTTQVLYTLDLRVPTV